MFWKICTKLFRTKSEEDIAHMNNYIEDTENIQNKLVELEDCSRQNNTWIDAVK